MTHPARRSPGTLTALTAAHLVVLVGAVVLAGLLMVDGLSDTTGGLLPGDGEVAVLAVGLLAASLGALAVGQVLSIRRLTTHSRAAAGGRLDESTLAAGVRRIGWPVALAFYPLVLGVAHLVLNPPPTTLLAALVAVVAASLLLDLGHAGWTCRRLPHTTGTRLLPPGSRSRIHTGQNVTAALHVGLAVAGAALLVATALAEIDRPAAPPLATVVQMAAAFTAVLVPLRLIPPVRRVSAAITTTDHGADVVDLSALDRAAHTFIRLRVLGSVAAALGAAALLAAPADPALAAARAMPLLLALGSAALQLGSLTSINLADTARPVHPRR